MVFMCTDSAIYFVLRCGEGFITLSKTVFPDVCVSFIMGDAFSDKGLGYTFQLPYLRRRIHELLSRGAPCGSYNERPSKKRNFGCCKFADFLRNYVLRISVWPGNNPCKSELDCFMSVRKYDFYSSVWKIRSKGAGVPAFTGNWEMQLFNLSVAYSGCQDLCYDRKKVFVFLYGFKLEFDALLFGFDCCVSPVIPLF